MRLINIPVLIKKSLEMYLHIKMYNFLYYLNLFSTSGYMINQEFTGISVLKVTHFSVISNSTVLNMMSPNRLVL